MLLYIHKTTRLKLTSHVLVELIGRHLLLAVRAYDYVCFIRRSCLSPWHIILLDPHWCRTAFCFNLCLLGTLSGFRPLTNPLLLFILFLGISHSSILILWLV